MDYSHERFVYDEIVNKNGDADTLLYISQYTKVSSAFAKSFHSTDGSGRRNFRFVVQNNYDGVLGLDLRM